MTFKHKGHKTENNDCNYQALFTEGSAVAILLQYVSESQVNVTLQGIMLNERNIFRI